MPQIGPFVKLFLALLVALLVLFGWQRADMAALETRIEVRFDRLETGQSGLRERMTRLETRFERLETGQSELRERMVRLEAGQSELRERTARIEGTVAGALSRPGTLAQAVENDEASAN